MCCAGVCTRSYALQILHKIEDYDTLWINPPLTGDSELNPRLKTQCVSSESKLMQLTKSRGLN